MQILKPNMSCKKIKWNDNKRWDLNPIWANGQNNDNERCFAASAMKELNICPKGYKVYGGAWKDNVFKGHSSCTAFTGGPYRRRCYKYEGSAFEHDILNISKACLFCNKDSIRKVDPKYYKGSNDCNNWLAKFCMRKQNMTDGIKIGAACEDYLKGGSTFKKQLLVNSCRAPYDYKYGEKLKYKGNWNKVFLPYFRCVDFLKKNKDQLNKYLKKICTIDRIKNEQVCRTWIANSPSGKSYAQKIISEVCPYDKLKTDKTCQKFVKSLDGKIDEYVEGFCKGIGKNSKLCDCYNSPDNVPGWCLPACLSGHAYQTEAIRTSLKGGGKCTICKQNVNIGKSQLQEVTIKQDCSNIQAKSNLKKLYQTCVSLHGVTDKCQYLKDKLKEAPPIKFPKAPLSNDNQIILLFILILLFIVMGSGGDSKLQKSKIIRKLFVNKG